MTWGEFIFWCAVAYQIGSIPFSWVLVKLLKGIDLRTVGSGNLGSTNATRVLGWKWGLVIQALDILKGWGPVFAVALSAQAQEALRESLVKTAKALVPHGLETVSPDLSATTAVIAVGLSAILGHMFPIYLRFRGGKGVNTSLGVFLALAPKAMAAALGVGLLVLAIGRYVSLASITGAIVFPIAVGFLYPKQSALLLISIAVGMLIVFLHRSNVRRLLAGTESRLGKKVVVEKSDESESDQKRS